MLVVAAILGGLLLLVVGDDDDDGSSGASPEDIEKLQDELLDKTVVDPAAGISVRRPSSWTDSKQQNLIRLRSKSHCVGMTLAAPTSAGQTKKLIDAAIASLRETQKGISFRPAGNEAVGGIPTASFRSAFKNEKSDEIRALVSVGKGTKFAYLTETVLGNAACKQDLATAQVILSSIEYTK